ncbi:MAG TPA: ABC transporter substrate-binding protein [Stellaceae bacterium]|nr:ABC transporter substrate-binding protein [Stellaceae bacterium]
MLRGARLPALLLALGAIIALDAGPAMAQKSGGILKLYHRDSPGSASIHEEATISSIGPFMGVFNNLVLFNQQEPQNRMEDIQPDLADSWSWNADFTRLSFKLHHGVKWHDGEPFTAKDVKCTWDLLSGKSTDKLRLNPRKAWYENLGEVVVEAADAVTFVLKRPQPAFLILLASGMSPVYPCHVPAVQMRTHPIGTGPFKFVEFKPNEYIKLTKNPDYWKPGRPYLDGIEWTIIPNRATQSLAFIAGQFDMTFPYEVTVQMMKDIASQAPTAICELTPTPVEINLLVNRDKPPFNDPDIRRAMQLSIDRKAFLDIIAEGKGQIGGAMQPPPAGLWGLPPDMLASLPGYGPDIEKSRAQARELMEKHGYGPNNRLTVKVSTRNIAQYRDPAVILIDQMKQIYIDGELEVVETANWFPKIARKDYMVGLNLTGSGVDDPDAYLFEHYACGSERNYTDYCNHDLEKLFVQQSEEADQGKRKKLVWDIDRQLQEDGARPIIYDYVLGTCHYPRVHGITLMVNSIFNGWRFEDAWLDR